MKKLPPVKVLPRVREEEEPNDPKREAYINQVLRRRGFLVTKQKEQER